MPGVFDISYKKKEVDEQIRMIVGTSYSFWRRLQMGGTGSQRFEIVESNYNIADFLEANVINYCNIELKQKGIVIYFRFQISVYAIPIAYPNLTIGILQNTITLQHDANYLKLKPAQNNKLNYKFFDLLGQIKNNKLQQLT